MRKLLSSDNQEIQRLCKEVSVFPKKDNSTGRIFFFRSDVEILKKVKELYGKSQEIAYRTNPENTALAVSRNEINPVSNDPDTNTIIDTVIGAKNSVINRLTSLIEEKLDGIDDVVVELIKSKVENEKLRTKLDQLTKENHNLMIDINKFKPVGLGLYKKSKDEFRI